MTATVAARRRRSPPFQPTAIYAERGVERYELGRELLERYADLPVHWIDAHHHIPELRAAPDAEFTRMKRLLVLGIRKSLRIHCQGNAADFIVPWTSSGCTAMCTYCYLVANWFKGAYLRIFVNREEMWDSLLRHARRHGPGIRYEVGSNSDLVIEHTLTGNLRWTIERFATLSEHSATFPTKFAYIDDLLTLDHRGRTCVRFSVNPPELVRQVEIGTSPLRDRLQAARRLLAAGYPVGLIVAPIMLVADWQEQYTELFDIMQQELDPAELEAVTLELIFMTYGRANAQINAAALPGVRDVFEPDKMRPKGPAKLSYKPDVRAEAEPWFARELARRFPKTGVLYIV